MNGGEISRYETLYSVPLKDTVGVNLDDIIKEVSGKLSSCISDQNSREISQNSNLSTLTHGIISRFSELGFFSESLLINFDFIGRFFLVSGDIFLEVGRFTEYGKKQVVNVISYKHGLLKGDFKSISLIEERGGEAVVKGKKLDSWIIPCKYKLSSLMPEPIQTEESNPENGSEQMSY